MVSLRRSALLGGRGCGHVRRSLWLHGDRWGTAAVSPGVCAVACCLLGHPESQGVGVTRMSGEGDADVAHEGCVCCSRFVLRVDGG